MVNLSLIATITGRTLGLADYALLFTYFAANLFIGWWFSRKKRLSSGDFFLGGGRVAWWAAAISYFATATSSISFMALPAKTYTSDWLSFGTQPAQALAGVLVGLVFVGVLRRLNLTTIFGYLEQRFDRRVRLLGAGLSVMLKVTARMSVVMLLPALALSTVTGLNVYVSIGLMGLVTTFYAMEGGFEAVVWTDILQVLVTFGGVAIALAYIANGSSGGLSGIIDSAAAAGKLRAISWDLDVTQPTVWVFVGVFLGQIFTVVGDQPLMQRMLATHDVREARRTVVTGSAIGLCSSFLFFFVGTALWAFYQSHPERLAAALPSDAIFPYFIANELPIGVVGLIIAGLFAAAMGALSSALNASAAIIVTDFQPVLQPQATPLDQVRWARRSTMICGLIATGTAAFLAWRNVASLWDEFLKLTALIGGGFPGVFALGMLTKRANAIGAMIGVVGSIVITACVQAYTSVSPFLHVFVAIGSCFIIGYLASFLFPGSARGLTLNGLTLWTSVRNPSVISEKPSG